MVVQWGHFHLPATDLHTLDAGTEENPAIAIRFLFEAAGEFEIVEVTVGAQVAILLVRAAFAHKFTFLYVPFFSSVDGPATEVFAIEEPDLFLSGGCQRDAAGQC